MPNNLEKVEALIRKYEANKSYYHSQKYNETLLRSDFLDPLFEALGWDIKNAAGKSISEREVLLEESLRDGMMEHTKKPDYTFRLFSERKFFLEAKKPSVNIMQNNGPAQQVRRYGFTAGLKISVLSNFEDLSIYDMSIPVNSEDSVEKARIRTFHYTDYANVFPTLCRLLGRDSVYEGAFEKEWESINNKIDRTAPVDKYLLEQVNTWRLKLGYEIHAALPQLDAERLDDCVQSYINKILFLRVCEDRNIEEYQALLSIAQSGSFRHLIEKFVSSDRKYNSGLFASTAADQIISDKDNAFWEIIRQLYYPESPYSFSVLSSDVLGRIYEMFLSEKLQFRDGNIALVKKPENVDKDVVTTPTFVIRALLSKTVRRMCQGKSIEDIKEMSFADIACGSGAFLLELFGLLCDITVEYYLVHDRSVLIQTSVDTYRLSYQYKKEILVSCIYGVDKDYNAVEATKFGLLLKLLENEDVNSLSEEHPILPNLDNNIYWGNSLIDSDSSIDLDEQSKEKVNPFDFNERRFNLIIGNPPYMKTEDMKNINKKEFPIYKKLYHSAYKQYDKYFLFIERGLSLLKDDGMLAFIVPNKFMKVDAGTNLRSMISEGKELTDLTSFGANLVFSDKSTYTCLLVLSKTPQDSFLYTEVKDLGGWIANNPTAFSSGIKDSTTIGEDVWILYPNSLESVYQRITDNTISLSSIVGEDNIFNGIQTSAVKTYVITPIALDDHYVYFQHDGVDYKVERKFTRPFFKTSRGDDALNAYHTFKSNSVLIYPYVKKRNGSIDIAPLQYLEREAPCLYAYLMDNKRVLAAPSRDILPKSTNENLWHRYGREQSLDMGSVRTKLIVGVLSKGNKYSVDTNGVFLASGGTAGYCAIGIPRNCPYSPYYLQAVLTSKYDEWIASLLGEIFRGGFIARGTKALKRMPIKIINFENAQEKELHDTIAAQQRKLIRLGDKISALANDKRRLTVAKRAFDVAKRQQDDNLKTLFRLTDELDRQVLLISEMYAAY